MNIVEAKDFIFPFLKTKEQDIFNLFRDFFEKERKCITFGESGSDYESLFIEGSRKDKCLLVAHVDTVFQDSPHISPAYHDGLIFSKQRERGLNKKSQPYVGGFGIGADDRAGVAILWALKDLGHSLLLTGCEELGCLGSMQIMSNEESASMIQNHQFAVQFDRQGRNDIVFYNVGSSDFEKYVEDQTGYKKKEGSFTDICVLCEQICGVNMSVGYKNEHGSSEVLNLRWWIKTLEVANSWLSKNNLKRFVH